MRIRVVLVNWNSFEFTDRCLTSLDRSGFSAGEMEVVVVDNASHDGSLERLRQLHPRVEYRVNTSNLGFAEACNRGMRDRDGLDAIALVNNDAWVQPGWLESLCGVMSAEPGAGAVAAMLVLDPEFTAVHLHADSRVVLDSVRVDGDDVTRRCVTSGAQVVGDPTWPLSVVNVFDGRGTVWVPVGPDAHSVELGFSDAIDLPEPPLDPVPVVGPGSGPFTADVEIGGSKTVTVGVGDRVELVNGLGTRRTAAGEAYDIGFGVPVDQFSYPDPATVDGFCGGGVLLRCAMLDDVGLFDPRFFAYYEDTDLSWRMSRRGWTVAIAPEARIRHSFGGSGGSSAPWFFFLNYRNWLLTSLRNGDGVDRRRALSQLGEWLRPAVRSNIIGRVRRGRPPSLRLVGAWCRVVLGVLVALPRLWVVRGSRIGRRSTSVVRGILQPR